MTPGFCLGIGLSSSTDVLDAIELVERALAKGGIAAGQIVCIATIDTRCHNAVVGALAARYQANIRSFGAATLEAQTPRLKNPSEILFKRIGCHGVAEAAALAAGGGTARLLVEKMSGRGVTVAIAG